jgi:hypothetical protein
VSQESEERLVVVTSTPDGMAPLSPGERSMIQHEAGQIEQTAFVYHSFPELLPQDPARMAFEDAKRAFAESFADETIEAAERAISLQPNYLPAHVYEELGLNIKRRRNLEACVAKCEQTIRLAEALLRGEIPHPPTTRPIESVHIQEMLDMIRYNYSDRLMRLGRLTEALTQIRSSETLPKLTEGLMKRRLKEASLLYRLGHREASRIKIKQARAMDRELFYLLQDRMAFDGHQGLDIPL